MKNIKKLFSVVLIVVMLASMFSLGMVAQAAATPSAQTIKAAPGETVTIKLSEGACFGLDGSIKYSNRSMFSSVTPGNSPYGPITATKFILSNFEKVEFVVTLTAKISADAQVGDTCTVTFSDYLRVDDKTGNDFKDGLNKSVTVQVIEKKVDPSSKPSGSSSKPTTSSKPTSSKPTTTSKPASTGLDFTSLKKQISIANGLTESDYSADSWANMQTALAAAKAALKASTQAEINTAASNLKKAIANLVRLYDEDLSALIKEAKDFLAKDELKALSDRLVAAIEAAEKALKNGNDEAVALATKELKDALAAYKAKLEELGKGEIIGVDTPVEVNPTDDYCNIWLHKLWLILFIVSFVINLGLVGFGIYYFKRRKKNFTDNTPLIDYDINDD
ncbi:MAG: hypothetical protein IJD71_04580 [Clostridia bacterium]|nr:hypothetical protein [Clostridia bacterium]